MHFDFLMDITLYLNIHRIIPLELPLIQPILILVRQLNSAFLSVFSLSFPKHILDDVVDGHVDRCAL